MYVLYVQSHSLGGKKCNIISSIIMSKKMEKRKYVSAMLINVTRQVHSSFRFAKHDGYRKKQIRGIIIVQIWLDCGK